MRVKNITVKGLFGAFDHEIPLQSADRVTIILGPNGFGKTVMLSMIAALVEGTTSVFERTPFAEFCLELEDGTARIIRREVESKKGGGKPLAKLEFSTRDVDGNMTTASQSPVPADLPQSILSEVDSLVPGPFNLRGGVWVDDEGDQYSLAEILDRFPAAASALPRKYRPTFFSNGTDELRVFFVQTNRLGRELARSRYLPGGEIFESRLERPISEEGRRASTRVKQYAHDVVQRIRSVLADYAKHSQESDRTFPERLVRFAPDGRSALEAHEILSQMNELENKRQRLISLGLLDTETGLRGLTEDDVRREKEALTIYVGDVQEKLNVFDDIAHRIGILMDIINDRFRYKSLRIDREQGFKVLGDKEQIIRLEDLSSGEQHELVVLYELLFRAPENGLVLVDEPEISLHVAWQSRFLSDLIEILKLTNSYAIVATHSPVIIGTRSDLAVELKGPPIAG